MVMVQTAPFNKCIRSRLEICGSWKLLGGDVIAVAIIYNSKRVKTNLLCWTWVIKTERR